LCGFQAWPTERWLLFWESSHQKHHWQYIDFQHEGNSRRILTECLDFDKEMIGL
jgi:hypothetical protein